MFGCCYLGFQFDFDFTIIVFEENWHSLSVLAKAMSHCVSHIFTKWGKKYEARFNICFNIPKMFTLISEFQLDYKIVTLRLFSKCQLFSLKTLTLMTGLHTNHLNAAFTLFFYQFWFVSGLLQQHKTLKREDSEFFSFTVYSRPTGKVQVIRSSKLNRAR